MKRWFALGLLTLALFSTGCVVHEGYYRDGYRYHYYHHDDDYYRR